MADPNGGVGMGLGTAAMGGGVADALKSIIAQRLVASELAQRAQAAQAEQDYRNKALEQQSKDRELQMLLRSDALKQTNQFREDQLAEAKDLHLNTQRAALPAGAAVSAKGPLAEGRPDTFRARTIDTQPFPGLGASAPISAIEPSQMGRGGSIQTSSAPTMAPSPSDQGQPGDVIALETAQQQQQRQQAEAQAAKEAATQAHQADQERRLGDYQTGMLGVAQENAATNRLNAGTRAEAATNPKPKPLAFQTAQNIGAINAAEVEGVKILKALKDTGLDHSNDPADPRWEKFVVATLKVAPGDWTKADIQQRTAYVNAAMTRQLMGARPNIFVAKLIQDHLPQGQMSGMQLAHVLGNVMEQSTELRKETANLSNQPYEKLKPVSGQGYEDYVKDILSPAQTGSGPDLYQEYLKQRTGK